MLSRLLALAITIMNMSQSTLFSYVDQTNMGGNLYLVNRTYTISREYIPPDLVRPNVKCSSSSVEMRKDAAEALEILFASAKEEKGYVLVANSGYRSYGQQQAIYKRKVASNGRKQLLVAPPGASEHQLGMAMDIARKNNQSLTQNFGETDEGIWVSENAHRFGFIIRYQKEWTNITGYAYEPWHLRYVGMEHAQCIKEKNVPLETYVEQLWTAKLSALSAKGSVPTEP